MYSRFYSLCMMSVCGSEEQDETDSAICTVLGFAFDLFHLFAGPNRFSGGRAVGVQASDDEPPIGGFGELNGKVQQCLKHLAKSNSTTKLKALEVCF